MKTTRKLLALLVLAMLCVAFAIGASAETDGDWTYTVSNNKATITAYAGTDKNVTVPATLGGYAVVTIGENVFSGNQTLETVSFPDSLKTIGAGAFENCTALKTLTIPVNMVRIGSRAFAGCTGISEITVHAYHLNDCMDGGGTFEAVGQNTDGVTVVFSDSATYVPDWMFVPWNEYAKIKSVYIGNSVTTIGKFAFECCEELEKVVLGKSVYCIDTQAFEYCSSLNEINFPSGLTEIGTCAFVGCESLTEVKLPRSVAIIRGDYVFDKCPNLTIYGFSGTVAESYAKSKNIPFALRTDEEPAFYPFTDVPSNMYYYDAIHWAYGKGITAGTSATAFSPEKPCTRAQVVAFLWRNYRRGEVEITSVPFVDVSTDAYYYDALLWAYKLGIVYGVDSTHFAPDKPVTRGEFVAFLYRAAQNYGSYPIYEGCPFTDVKADAYYYPAVQWASGEEIVFGKTETTFAPNDPCTRGQVAAFLYRHMG